MPFTVSIGSYCDHRHSKFNKYWSIIHGIMGMAAVLDPRYKLKFVELLFPVLYGEEKEKIEFQNLEGFVKTLFQEYESSVYGGSVPSSSSFGSSISSGHHVGFKNLLSDIASITRDGDESGGMSELDNYLKEKLLPKDMELDLLAFYPTLQRIAKDILAIPVSTVASESAFSTSGRLVSPHCIRLHLKTLEALMCAQKTEAYCCSVEFDYDVEEENTKESETTSLDDFI
uniref:HAT C-terminal dimerisation domain-containing protein n=1 Tax=Lactuca sativa TaxID=4236 RepID=A0A9R1X1W2_LACSA|nr:hypothetical protein LSAT_V11C700377110 [Lactuca sativa]